MKVAILQSNYIPWKGYFDIINKADVFIIYDEVQYTKNDWRNRNLIKTANGKEWITIPVRQKQLGQTIDDTYVLNNLWRKKHPRMLQANYSKATFFKELFPVFMDIYEKTDILSLSEINYSFICKVCELLGINTRIIYSKELHLRGDKLMKLIDACNKLNATTYISGPAAKSYIDEDVFQKHQIKVEWMDYEGYPEYPQLFPPFVHGVSILDLLFNVGPANAKEYMKSF